MPNCDYDYNFHPKLVVFHYSLSVIMHHKCCLTMFIINEITYLGVRCFHASILEA